MLKLNVTLDGNQSPADLVGPLGALQAQEDVQVNLSLQGKDPQAAQALAALVATLHPKEPSRHRLVPALLGALAVMAYLSVGLFGLP